MPYVRTLSVFVPSLARPSFFSSSRVCAPAAPAASNRTADAVASVFMTPPVVLAWCAFAADDSTMAAADTDTIRAALLALHRELVEEERRRYEKIHGRQSGADFLQTLIADPAFAWLAPLTTLIVRLDELEEAQDA